MALPVTFANSGIKLIPSTLKGVLLVLQDDIKMELFVNDPTFGAPTFESPVTGQGAIRKWDGKQAVVAYSQDQTSGRTLTLPMQGMNGYAASGIGYVSFDDAITLCKQSTVIQYALLSYDATDGLAPTETIDINKVIMGDGDAAGNFSITLEYETRNPRGATI